MFPVEEITLGSRDEELLKLVRKIGITKALVNYLASIGIGPRISLQRDKTTDARCG